MKSGQGREGTLLSQAQPQPSPRRCPHPPTQSHLAPPQPLLFAEAALPGRLVRLFLVPASPINRLCTQPRWWVTAQLPLARGGREALSQSREARPRLSLEEEAQGPQKERSPENIVPSPGGQWLLCCGAVGSQTQLWAPAQRKRHPQLCRPQGSGSPSPCSHSGRRDREGPQTSTCQPQRRVQTMPHLERPMTSPGGARELPARQRGLRGPNLQQGPCCLAS